jgi:hypothetical protein
VRNDVPLKQCVMKHQARLKSELIKIKIKRGATSNDDLVSQKVKDAGKTGPISSMWLDSKLAIKCLFQDMLVSMNIKSLLEKLSRVSKMKVILWSIVLRTSAN